MHLYEAKRYEPDQKGGILLSVHCGDLDEVKRAKKISRANRGEDVSIDVAKRRWTLRRSVQSDEAARRVE